MSDIFDVSEKRIALSRPEAPINRILLEGIYFNFSIIEISELHLVLNIYDTSDTVVHELRKIISSEIEIFSINVVNIYKNSSQWTEEAIVSRIRKIPIISDRINSIDGEPEYQLKVKIPKDSKNYYTVTSDDIIQITNYDTDVFSLEEPMEITKIAPGNEVDIFCRAAKGINLKPEIPKIWSSVSSLPTILEKPIIRLYRNIDLVSIEEKERFVKSCPTGVYSLKGGIVDIEDMDSCINCGVCTELLDDRKQEPFVEITLSNTEFEFTIKSKGNLTAGRIFTDAVRIIAERYNVGSIIDPSLTVPININAVRIYSMNDILDGGIIIEEGYIEESYII